MLQMMKQVALGTKFLAWICFDVQVLVNTYPHSFVALARLNSYKYIKTISSVGKSTNFQTVL